MAQNGAAVLLSFEPPSTPANPSTEIEIGQAVAAAATAICLGAAEYMAGELSSTTRAAGGERIAALYWLQEAHAGVVDFPTVAYEQGRKVLWTYIQAGQRSPDAAEAMIDLALTTVLDVLAKVTATERALH